MHDLSQSSGAGSASAMSRAVAPLTAGPPLQRATSDPPDTVEHLYEALRESRHVRKTLHKVCACIDSLSIVIMCL